MSIRTLKFLRLIVPGFMILLVLVTIQKEDLSELSKVLKGVDLSKKSAVFYVIPIVLGAVYYALGLRNVFFERPIQAIQRNIRQRLVSEFDADPDISPHAQKLVENRNVIQVFYGFVDSNPSLTEKSNNVRANGLVLSSFADAAIISLLAALVYLALLVFSFSFYYALVFGLCVAVCVLSRFLFLPRITKIHLDYSNSQIDFIITNLRNELREALKRIIATNPGVWYAH